MKPEAGAYAYDNDFFSYIEEGARRSAQVIVPLLAKSFHIGSVLDVGCGRGVWVREWADCGIDDVVGVDGAYVDDAWLAIPPEQFVRCDLSQPFALKRRFDLIQSLEVAEHIASSSADTFVTNLAAHGDVILFSAAVPGQGGELHVNERPYEYWRDKFAANGFRTFDWLRPRIRSYPGVEPWYRYNTLIFARDCALNRAAPDLLETEILPDQPVPIRSAIMARSQSHSRTTA
jgi:SAM-dependent methyltransferase